MSLFYACFGYFKRVLLSACVVIPPLRQTSICVRTHRAKSGFYRRVYPAYIFDSYPLPLFRRLTVGAAIEKNFFWFYFFVSPIRFLLVFYFFLFFLNPLSTRSNYTSIFIFFLIFARNLSEVGIENILNFILVILDYKIPRIFFSC